MTLYNNECEIHSDNKGQKNGNEKAKNQWLLEHSQERDFFLRDIISVSTHQLQLLKITYLICVNFAVLDIL